MFPHSDRSFSSSRSPLIPWLVAGLMALALAPATAGAMPGREQAQPVPVAPAKQIDSATRVYARHGLLPMSHSMQSPAVASPSSGDGTDTWLIAGALLAACAVAIGAARKTRVRAVRHA